MEHVQVDWSPCPVSRVVLGGGVLGGQDWGKVREDDVLDAVQTSMAYGVTAFDTADVYGLGQSERALARALGSGIRKCVVTTKGGVAWEAPKGTPRATTYRDVSARHLRAAVENSLTRLGLESVPLYFAHWPDGRTPVADVVETLVDLRDRGLVGAVGLSNFSVQDLMVPGVLDAIDAVQFEHNLLVDGSVTAELCAGANVLVLAYGALGQGLLTGRYRSGHTFGKDDQRHRLPHFQNDRPRYEPLLEELNAVAEEAGVTMGQVAVRWVLESLPQACAVVGARNPRQARENAEAASVQLGSAAVARLAAASRRVTR